MLIRCEGIGGSGKSAQSELLKVYLESVGKEVNVYREPGGVTISEQIRELLLNSKHKIHPVSELLLFSAARAQLVADKVLPDLENGKFVVLDRFFDSTTAYQGFGRKSVDLEKIEQINELASLGREPDLTFYLRLDWEESKKRTSHLEEDRMEKAGEEFFKRVITGFDHLSKTKSRFVKIDAKSDINSIHEKIIKKLSDFL